MLSTCEGRPFSLLVALVAAPFAGLALAAHLGAPLVPAVLALSFAQVLVLGVLEGREAFWHDRQSWKDIGHAVAMLCTARAVMAAAAPYVAPLAPLHLWPTDLPFALQFALFLILGDGLDYVRHRALHRVPVLWRFHELHHAVDRLHVFRKHRFHFVEGAVRSLLVELPLLLLGAPAPLFAWGLAAMNFLGYPAHAAVRFRTPGPFHRVVVTPAVHRLHHDRRRAIHDGNYGALFSLWDVLLGTFRDPVAIEQGRVGVEGTPHAAESASFVRQMLAPFGRRAGSIADRRDLVRLR